MKVNYRGPTLPTLVEYNISTSRNNMNKIKFAKMMYLSKDTSKDVSHRNGQIISRKESSASHKYCNKAGLPENKNHPKIAQYNGKGATEFTTLRPEKITRQSSERAYFEKFHDHKTLNAACHTARSQPATVHRHDGRANPTEWTKIASVTK